MSFSLRTKPINIAIIIKMNVEFPVVKKLPVLLMGNISTIKRKMKGITILLSFKKDDFVKYFLKRVRLIIKAKIDIDIKKPIIPVSVNISK